MIIKMIMMMMMMRIIRIVIMIIIIMIIITFSHNLSLKITNIRIYNVLKYVKLSYFILIFISCIICAAWPWYSASRKINKIL